MQVVSERFNEITYSGDALYSCNLQINGIQVPNEQLTKIVISNPIIDTTSEIFYIGTFISQQLEITFHNFDGIDIQAGNDVELSISLDVDGSIEPVKIGHFIIDELKENYQSTNKITCLDNGSKFLSPVDFHSIYTEENPTATIEEILQWICNYYEVSLGDYPNVNRDIRVSSYDSTLSGKQYVSWIAEMMGGNAKIDRDGKLVIKPLKTDSVLTINALEGKNINVGARYKISKVTYFDAVRNFSFGEDTDNTLIIRQNNMFVTEAKDIENIYNAVKDFEIYSLTFENRGNIALDPWDIITLKTDEMEYPTINSGTLDYHSIIWSKLNVTIPSKQQEVTTNVFAPVENQIRRVWTEVDNINNEIKFYSQNTYTKEDINDINKGLFNDYFLTGDTTYKENKDYYSYNVEEQTYTLLTEGIDYNVGDRIEGRRYEFKQVNISYVVTEKGMFTNEGLRIQQVDENDLNKIISETSGLFNEIGLTIQKVEDGKVVEGKPILFSGYVKDDNEFYGRGYGGQSITATENIIVEKYATFGTNSRIEDFEEDGTQKTGMFPIGG